MLANIIALFTKAMLDIKEKTKINALKESWRFVGVLALIVFFSYNIVKIITYYELELALIKIKSFNIKTKIQLIIAEKMPPRKSPSLVKFFVKFFHLWFYFYVNFPPEV